MGIRQPCGCPNVVRCMPIVAVFPPNRRSRVGNNSRNNNNNAFAYGTALLLFYELCAMPTTTRAWCVHIGCVPLSSSPKGIQCKAW
mmetsp:Transcript_45933/g.52156  ORF Transcript_45933/g.52156 Transcript_45933/m.52156 type:complete len:86 (+) Transcript_45933:275-532(+)